MMLINGARAESITATDRGLAYGDGMFRTLAALQGQPLHWPLHYAKFAADCVALKLSCPDDALLRREVETVAAGEARCAIKMVVTRGSGPRGYAPPSQPEYTRIVMRTPWPATNPHADGITMRVCRLRLAHQPALAGIKHLNRLENVLARAEWSDPAIAEGLLLDGAGHAIGGTMSNLFIVENGVLVTPDLSLCGVAGVTRQRVLAAAQSHGTLCRIEHVALARVWQADEVFVLNSLIGLWPVRQLEDRIWPAGNITARVAQWLKTDDVM